MCTVTSEINGESLIIFLSGKIDSNNAAQVEVEIMKLQEDYPDKTIILDAKNLSYISSAGLRVILKLCKKQKDLSMINVSSEVYDILNMTGFTELLKVSKVLREISVDGCEVIGAGGHGAVYRIDDETIVKIFYEGHDIEEVQREQEYARKAFVHGIPTAIPYDIVKCGDNYGLVYELIKADTLANVIKNNAEEADNYIRKYGELLKFMHSIEITDNSFDNIKDLYNTWADGMSDYFNESEIATLHNFINSIPERNTVIHGDFHPKNILVQNGELIIIDMDNIGTGHPIFDLAAISLVLNSAAEHTVGFSPELGQKVWNDFLSVYFDTTDPAKLAQLSGVGQAFSLLKLTLAPAINRTTSPELSQLLVNAARQRFFPNADNFLKMLSF